MKKPSFGDVKKAILQVQETKNCPYCNKRLEEIKTHRDNRHKDPDLETVLGGTNHE